MNVGVQEIFSPLFKEMEFDQLIMGSYKDDGWTNNLEKLVLSRIEESVGKLNTSENLEKDHAIILPAQKLYSTIDKVSQFEDIKRK